MRIYNITVNTNAYKGISTDEIVYQIYWPPEATLMGSITGPVNPADQIEPTPWYINIPPITIPIIFVGILLIAYWKKLL